jgi:hypothetical protein
MTHAGVRTRVGWGVMLATALASCGDDHPSAPPPVVGEPCAMDGAEVCSGNAILRCEAHGNGLYWKLTNDCGAKGKVCWMKGPNDGDCG